MNRLVVIAWFCAMAILFAGGLACLAMAIMVALHWIGGCP